MFVAYLTGLQVSVYLKVRGECQVGDQRCMEMMKFSEAGVGTVPTEPLVNESVPNAFLGLWTSTEQERQGEGYVG